MNAAIQELADAGFDVIVADGLLIVGPVMYRKRDGLAARGELAMELNQEGSEVVRPSDHTVRWVGDEVPCDTNGSSLGHLIHDTTPSMIMGRSSPCGMSRTKGGVPYPSYEEKARTYARLIENGGGFRSKRLRKGKVSDERRGAGHSAHGEIQGLGEALKKVAGQHIVIVGLGGTGAYILDMVSKTRVQRVVLFDGQRAENKNLLRWPGVIGEGELEGGANKAELLARTYVRVHPGIQAYGTDVGEENLGQLRSADMVFICVDRGESRRLITDELIRNRRRFIDTGIGMEEQNGQMWGSCRITVFDGRAEREQEVRKRLPVQQREDDIYDRNIQIVEMNALNAAMAVTAWKQLSGVYRDGRGAAQVNLHTASWHLIAKGVQGTTP